MEKKIEKLIELRPFILWMEMAGLLHDIGKLSRQFIEYRTKWQEAKDGWDNYNDPHPAFLDQERPHIKRCYPDLDRVLNITLGELLEDWMIKDEWKKELEYSLPLAKNYNLYDMVREHQSPHSRLSSLLEASDQKDAAIDRNNPLLAGEQEDISNIFFSNVFGHEEKIDVGKLEDERKSLFSFLSAGLPDYLTGKDRFEWNGRKGILEKLEECFRKGLSHTYRPVNDILLWEHCYATATILKVLIAHFILTGEYLDAFKKVRFSILGIGWDGMAYYSRGEKMADISAKKQLIEDLKGAIRQIVEYEIPVGNTIYHDDDGIYFLLPPRVSGHEEVYDSVIGKIKQRVRKEAGVSTDDEIQPIFEIEKETKFVTAIVKVIERIRERAAYTCRADSEPLSLKWMESWQGKELPICPVCRKRPADKGKICKICFERRGEAQRIKRGEEEALFIDDIADENGRVCFILCDFELREWLNGNMIRTLMVKEPYSLAKEIEKLGEIKGFREEEKEKENERKEIIKKYLKEYRSIDLENYSQHQHWLDDIKLCEKYPDIYEPDKKEYAKAIFPLYDRRGGNIEKNTWQEWLKEAKEEHGEITLENILLTKTPTPSRIFRVWNETEQFFVQHAIQEIKASIGEKKRIRLDLSNPEILLPLIIYDDVEILGTGERISLIREEDDQVFVIGKEYKADLCKEWQGKALRIPLTEFDKDKGNRETTVIGVAEGGEFHPFRTITISPNLFMALVPSEKALEISKRIHDKYIERMGKVTGRLPLAIANIFFPGKMPIFAVLDMARRTRENFRNVSRLPRGFKIEKKTDNKFTLEGDGDQISIELFTELGDGKEDYYYPYFVVRDKEGLENKFYLETPMGIVAHWDNIDQKNIHNYVNLYDFEFMDSSTRRLFVSQLSGNRRYHTLLRDKGLKPYLLEQLDQLLMKIWEELKEAKVTDTQINGLESLLGQKFLEWQMWSDGDGKRRIWEDFIQSTMKLQGLGLGDFISAAKDGVLFDCIELYMKIMKEKLREGV